MNKEMALLGLEVTMALKGIFALCALIASIKAIRMYKRFGGMQKVLFWFASTFSVIAMLWVATMTFIIVMDNRWVVDLIPSIVYFMVFASPTAAIAAGAAMGMFTRNTPNVQQIPQSS